MTALSDALLSWYDQNKRTLPFRGTRDPYRIWLSEIMLQQTRTETVGAYYERFLKLFPDVDALANANEQDVLKAWEGLGYYSRARNLLKAARVISEQYKGNFPSDLAALHALPGVGDYTAAAVASIAFDVPAPAMDGNLTRVLSRVYGVRQDATIPSVKRELLRFGQETMPKTRCGEVNQALMDIGATICTPGTPNCDACPLISFCDASRVGDAENLPVLPVKRPPKEENYSVLLLTNNGKIFMEKREQALLGGLYVYLLAQEAEIEKELKKRGIAAELCEPLGDAKHVFTHRIWHMRLLHYTVTSCAKAREKDFYSLDEMLALPIPTAMRVARQRAKELLTPAKYLVEPLSTKELQKAGEVYAASWRALHKPIVSPEFLARHTPAYHEALLRARMQTGNPVYIARDGQEIGGVLCLSEETGEVMQLYVAPSSQGKGIGGALLTFAIRLLRPRGRVFLTVLESNHRARAFYEKHGFAFLGKRTLLDEKTGLYEMTYEWKEGKEQ